MIKGIIEGIRSYFEAHELIKKHKLYGYVFLPGLINLVLFIITLFWGWKYSSVFSQYFSNLVQINVTAGGWGFAGDIIQWTITMLFRLLFLILYLYFYKYIILIIMSPVLALLSEKTDEILTGNNYPFNLSQFIKDVVRGVVIAVRNLGIELLLLIFLFFFSYIPILGWISPVLMLMVECYYYGFSMIDYSNERKKLSVKESSSMVFQHKWMAMANGGMFYMLLLIPVIGIMAAPSYGVVAATIAVDKMRIKR